MTSSPDSAASSDQPSGGAPSDAAWGDAGTSMCAELGIRPGMRVALLHASAGIEELLAPVPEGAVLQHGLRRHARVDLIVGFVSEQSHLASNIGWLLQTLPEEGAFWVVSPTPASGAPTDMDRDAVDGIARSQGWRAARTLDLDDDWSAVQIVRA